MQSDSPLSGSGSVARKSLNLLAWTCHQNSGQTTPGYAACLERNAISTFFHPWKEHQALVLVQKTVS